jgi:hypothetical protein
LPEGRREHPGENPQVVAGRVPENGARVFHSRAGLPVQPQGVLGVLQGRPETCGQVPTRCRRAGNDEQRLGETPLPAHVDRRVEQRGPDSPPAVLRVDHADEFHDPTVPGVEPDEPHDAATRRPEQVVGVVPGPVAQASPLDLQAPAVMGDDASLEVGHVLQVVVGQAVPRFQHGPSRPFPPGAGQPESGRVGRWTRSRSTTPADANRVG